MATVRGFPHDVIGMRRALHRFPECGFLEYRTAACVAERLAELGYDLRIGPEVMRADAMLAPPTAAAIAQAQQAALDMGAGPEWIARMPEGQTAVVADMRRGAGPVTALRFDIDALPVAEAESDAHRPFREGFASIRPGRMHACGHDGHTAIGLAVAAALASPESRWRGTLRLIFQPAEEGGRGALPLVEAGVVDDVDLFFAGHLGCLLPSGQVATAANGFLWAVKQDVIFRGAPAHAAMAPQLGRNALLAAAAAALGLHAMPRDGDGVTHVNVGTVRAGTARNVIADHAVIEMEYRGETEEILASLAKRVDDIVQGAARMQDVAVETIPCGRSIGIAPDREAMRRVAEAAGRIGVGSVVEEWPIGGGDDATYFMRRVRERGGHAGYCLIGADLSAGHHAGTFDFDEAALPVAVRLFTALVEGA
ncbi:amidohydrolase [Gluconacetobacter tumulicola]|uniref:Amidohydrolase n=1 Tax=Gluconacetobacter tumulicola TaxID=1017177 RepID=A0A7W4P5M4_9PROT|nr:amidohydrolase [Gluconacetobacter tumulicola]MBB2178019.1 amidohydrolase [Gluconacetobacter tumulicola]